MLKHLKNECYLWQVRGSLVVLVKARRALARDTDDRDRDPGWQHQTTPLLAADIGSPGTTKKKEEDECEGAYGSAGRHAETEHPLRAPMLLLGSATALRDAAAPSARADTGKKLPAEYGLLARLLACLLAAARRFSLERASNEDSFAALLPGHVIPSTSSHSLSPFHRPVGVGCPGFLIKVRRPQRREPDKPLFNFGYWNNSLLLRTLYCSTTNNTKQ
ncbi:hypothetical protein HPB47_027075 [Ixodes persulcatus]|uniref:Uncharacterized protein n=1 Tax=Ixodes persulcatus TaxID=34615 RepID=A0AC60PY30_IXOPE|nr:hypothetical protein HPB47_027075 [Ixodes persulcatus]